MRGRPGWTPLVIAALLVPMTIVAGTRSARLPAPDAARFLTRVTYGAAPADLARFERMGLEAWVEDALHPGDDPALTTRLAVYPTLGMTPSQLKTNYNFPPPR